uniref:Glutathione hydrolase proenzyme n=1 Tax=Thermorudis peleae TaxID=1382356 RepID=A0A831TAX1_9BACT
MRSIGAGRTGRPTTRATEGMVATPHYLASVAGLRVLQEGGNAVDAAVAANAVLNVVYPNQCSLGGDAFFLIWEPSEERLLALNGSGRAPAQASPEAVRAAGCTTMPQRGAWAVTVPGTVDAWAAALARCGSRPLGELLRPAIEYAERGFVVTPLLSEAIADTAEVLRAQAAAYRQFLPQGRPPRPGERLVQPDLARSLRLLAEHGPDAFYRGPIGEAIVATVRSARGVLTLDDLAEHRSTWVEPISTTYRGLELVELPPNTHGVTALEMANIMEGYEVADLGWGSAELLHRMVEAKKLAFADRDRYVGDPDFVQVPLDRLLDKRYAEELRRRIDPERALSVPSVTWDNDTVYLCAVDREGRAVSLIQSIFQSFGSGLVAEGTGIVLHNRGACFTLDPASPNCLAPGKRPLHTLIPAMLLRDGLPWVVFGSMGGHGQPQIQLQLLANLVDFELGPQAAIEAPRWLSRLEPGDEVETLYLEPGFDVSVGEELERRGHNVRWVRGWDSLMGHAQMIRIDREHGVLEGAADPRAEGYALGW